MSGNAANPGAAALNNAADLWGEIGVELADLWTKLPEDVKAKLEETGADVDLDAYAMADRLRKIAAYAAI